MSRDVPCIDQHRTGEQGLVETWSVWTEWTHVGGGACSYGHFS